MMKTQNLEGLTIVGLSIRTSNKNGEAMTDIPKLWGQFMSNKVLSKIPNKIDNTIYALYTDYVSDHTEPYTMLLGYQVSSLDNIPEELSVKIIPEAKYVKFTAKGDLTKDAVLNTWKTIWESKLDRAYTTDIEVYDDKAMNPSNGEASLFIALNS
ncbi:GyrI-like domain-containing protein [Flavicella sediminum]|uniref:GyrI-like domain-containing protein n=1 Tax=Flavicella sediminum TaxID=2585141 RepID=UPI001FB7379B|nr:GyrI-like domain-containing protein [Flavicella sediminum]